jgi:hypothetical protein
MKKSFALGAIAGMSSLALAIPVLAQISSAQDSGTTASTAGNAQFWTKRAPDTTTTGIQTRIDHDSAFLTNIDAMIAIQKSAIQTHKDALTAALSITDDTQRAAAIKAADEAMRTSIENAIKANTSLKDLMPFGGPGLMGGKGRGHGSMGGDLAVKLGMTETELKAAIESGKTIEDIAKEKGITLPARPAFSHFMMKKQSSSTSVQ